MPLPLNTVNPGDIILSDDWNDLVHLANKFRIDSGKLQIKNDGDIDGSDSFTSGLTSTVCLGDENHFVQAKKDFGVTISAEWAPAGLIIRKGGDTGIGTTDPKAKLDLHGGDEWTVDKWNKNLRLRGESPAVIFTEYGFNTNNKFGIGTKNNGSKLMIFSTNTDQEDTSGTASNHLVVQENGRLGIGIDNPLSKVHIESDNLGGGYGGVDSHGDFSIGNGTDTVLKIGVINSAGETYIASRGDLHLGTGHNDSYRVISIVDDNGQDEVLIDGNVGIGTTNPEGKLHIIGSASDANGKTLVIGPTNQSNLRLGYYSNYSWIQSHGGKNLSINPLGNKVGIGTTSPEKKLHIEGDAVIKWNNDTNIYGYANKAMLYLGDDSHFIRSEYAEGVTIGTWGRANALHIEQGGNGKILTNGSALIHIERFNGIGSTGFFKNEYNAVIVGFSRIDTKVGGASSGPPEYISLNMEPSFSGEWEIKSSGLYSSQAFVDVMFVRTEISTSSNII